MKKIVCFTLAVLLGLLCSCGKQTDSSDYSTYVSDKPYYDTWETYSEGDEENAPIVYLTGSYDYSVWNSDYGVHNTDAIPDINTAIDVAEAIFAPFENKFMLENYATQMVYFDNEKEVWIVLICEYSGDPDNPIVTFGGGFNIALQKKDGKVLRMWFD